MKFSEQWLREWTNPDVTTAQLSHQLTMAGLEVDAIEDVAAPFTGVVVAKVLKVEKHPDADKLRVCQVDAGQDEELTIVCGAANVREGLHVPAALIGAVLPGNFKIKKSKLRGVQSFGMLCSEQELGIAESADGLMELPPDSPIGTDIREYLQLDDNSIELGLTPNRGDCLSIAGVAREAGVLNNSAVSGPDINAVKATTDATFPVKITDTEHCPRYLGRVIKGVNPNAATPMWMIERLRRSDIRSLTPLVDVTNYLLLELGQPMHAFDLNKLVGGINVRLSNKGESLELLNESTIELDDSSLVISDDNGPVALAGIMGGEPSSVTEETTDIFLESAFFTPNLIAGKARQYGLHTDSSHRFERGVSPDLAAVAMERATQLILDICGGEVGEVTNVTIEDNLPKRATVSLRHSRIELVLGMSIERADVTNILHRLDMEVTETDMGWDVVAPMFRFDIEIEEDLIEEVGRIIGYDHLPVRMIASSPELPEQPEALNHKEQLRQKMIERGYQEAITYSFVDPSVSALLDPAKEPIKLANPISSDLSVMRTTLWSGLLPAVRHNVNRQQERVRLFETGLSFINSDDEIIQHEKIAGVICGPIVPEQWSENARTPDFFDIKGDCEALLSLVSTDAKIEFISDSSNTALHPGQAARIDIDGKMVGYVGAIHPTIAEKLDVPAKTFVFEMETEALLKGDVAAFKEISKFPAIRRDLAFVVDSKVEAKSVFDSIHESAPEFLTNLKLFDVYEGEHIDSGRKSLALGLTLQAQSRTLTDDEVDSAVNTIVNNLNKKLGATLRD
jgi:phenylalanyl-tRNA synthetase beta chain